MGLSANITPTSWGFGGDGWIFSKLGDLLLPHISSFSKEFFPFFQGHVQLLSWYLIMRQLRCRKPHRLPKRWVCGGGASEISTFRRLKVPFFQPALFSLGFLLPGRSFRAVSSLQWFLQRPHFDFHPRYQKSLRILKSHHILFFPLPLPFPSNYRSPAVPKVFPLQGMLLTSEIKTILLGTQKGEETSCYEHTSLNC